MTNLVKILQSLLGCLLLFWIGIPVAAEAYSCNEDGETRIWISPFNPEPDEQIKIMAVSTDGPVSELTLVDSQGGRRKLLRSRRRGGPPWSRTGTLPGLDKGYYQVLASRNGRLAACRPLVIGERGVRPELRDWDRATEAFYSAWIEALFAAPPKAFLSFPSLAPVIGSSERNFLHNYFGLDEDQGLPLTPDCGDLPYTLRAYFAWKLGLPFAFRDCDRGSASVPPHCGAAIIKTDFTNGIRSQAGFRKVDRHLVNTVHSGSARTALDDDATDFYPIALSRETLWPGTVFADPYGHILILVEWMPQVGGNPGLLWAVDAQPDNTVTRKRFWEGNFLFDNFVIAGQGFKAFRPLIRTKGGGWRPLSNAELLDDHAFAPFSLEQARLSSDAFYARLAALINPKDLDPKQVYETTLSALVEQLETRVTAVDNGEAYFHSKPGSVIAMPSGAAIFQTVGPWEDYSTPSRDMRLIIAMNALNDVSENVVRHPELFATNGRSPAEVKAEIAQYHARRIKERSIRYRRSDGSTWRLTVAEILARQPALEMAYNPNDCVEIRWGAKPGTEEYSTCRRHAPTDQYAKMLRYRIWFREARRPAG